MLNKFVVWKCCCYGEW